MSRLSGANLYVAVLWMLAGTLTVGADIRGATATVEPALVVALIGLIFSGRVAATVDGAASAFSSSTIFLFAGVILTPGWTGPELLLAIMGQQVWVLMSGRYRAWPWRMWLVEVSVAAICAALARDVWLVHWTFVRAYVPRSLVGIAAVLVFVAGGQCLSAGMAVLGRRVSLRRTHVCDLGYWAVELVLAGMGLVLAILWPVDPWLAACSAAPILLIYQALRVPQLELEARTDGKTGLYNARHFSILFANEIERAYRHEQPLALLMCDMDYLRVVNNTYGHAAGDVVIAGLARIIRGVIRETDIAARFGGEEYIVLAPELEYPEALTLAERLRGEVEAAAFSVSTSPEPIRVTVSIGVAVFPFAGVYEANLQHSADVAVYQAKEDGRNRVVSAEQVRADMWDRYTRERDQGSLGEPPPAVAGNRGRPASWSLVPWAYRLGRPKDRRALLAAGAREAGVDTHLLLWDEQRRVIEQAGRQGDQVVLAQLDIDGFGSFVARQGAVAGQEILLRVATLLRETRGVAYPVHHGGDSFLFLLPGMALTEGETVCRTLAGRLADAHAELTVSMGIAGLFLGELDHEVVYARAGEALAEARRQGGGRIVCFGQFPASPLLGSGLRVRGVRRLLAEGALSVSLDPVVAHPDGTLLGHAAVFSPRDGYGVGSFAEVLAVAESLDRQRDLDRVCVDAACGAFAQAGLAGLLFVSVAWWSLLGETGGLREGARFVGLRPEQIVLDLRVGGAGHTRILQCVALAREEGFAVAFSPLGLGEGGCALPTALIPDYLKVDWDALGGVGTDQGSRLAMLALAAYARAGGIRVVVQRPTDAEYSGAARNAVALLGSGG
ncbi:MAG TPA: diguanylate cyclase [Chloroflexota bacterium]|nr:diguanylate cyclase [Chloroflexota bacterium]